MPNETEFTDLEVHTLDSLCKELVSGRGIRYGENGDVLQFSSEKTRSIFNWYLQNRELWSGRNKKEDVESIVKQLEVEAPKYESLSAIGTGEEKLNWHLTSVRANQFGGVHRDEGLEEKEIFEYNCESDLSLFEGNNGSGKSSILSAICWCLTGYVYRSQKPPEIGSESFDVWINEDEADHELSFQIAKVTPIPSHQVLVGLEDKKVPIETWVELTFENDKNDETVTVRRSLQRKVRGAGFQESTSNISQLGLSPISLELGTRMPAQIPYIQLGEENDLSTAIAELTGLNPLKDLVLHAQKSKAKLEKDLPKKCDQVLTETDIEYENERKLLLLEFEKDADLFRDLEVPAYGSEDCETHLDNMDQLFHKLQKDSLVGAENILGPDFNVEDQDQIEELVQKTQPSITRLSSNYREFHLKSLNRIFDLAQLEDDETTAVLNFITQLIKEAEELKVVHETKDVAVRLQLYAKLASWMKERGFEPELLRDCPVCDTNIKEQKEPLTGKLITEHIREIAESNASHLEQTIAEWIKDSTRRLMSEFGSVSKELHDNLPEKPSDLIRNALVEELFQSTLFSGVLAPLKDKVQKLCSKYLSKMSAYHVPDSNLLHECLLTGDDELRRKINNIFQILAFKKWIIEYENDIQSALKSIVGDTSLFRAEANIDGRSAEEFTLLQNLNVLRNLVTDQKPLQLAIERIERLKKFNQVRHENLELKEKYQEAANEISDLFVLSNLVDHHVDGIMKPLAENTSDFKNKIYQPAYTSAPKIDTTKVQKNILRIQADMNGTKAEARHFCNASDIRANLIALLFSFWKHINEKQSSLSLFLYDDIQELFDPINKRRLADSITYMVNDGAHVILTTNDKTFAENVYRSSEQLLVDYRQVLPAKGNHQVVMLKKSIKTIYKKRQEFEKHIDEHQYARDYLNELRIYIECCFKDLFDIPDSDLPSKPTYSDYLNGIVNRVKKGFDGFSGKVFADLIKDPDLKVGSDVYELMNLSHHSNAATVSYKEVADVSQNLKKVTSLVHQAHEEYERWLRRESVDETVTGSVLTFDSVDLSFKVPLAATLSASSLSESIREGTESGEDFSSDYLEDHVIFYNRTDNMGFAGEIDSRLIVEANASAPEDKSWVIAVHNEKNYVRRVVYTDQHNGMVTLVGESENPLRRPPALHVKINEVQLFKIVGVLFDASPLYFTSKQEAELDYSYKLKERVKMAFKASGTSALPLAISGQTLLAGNRILPSELPKYENRLVGISTHDEKTLFKRVGKNLSLKSAANLRQFESIGGEGES
ncbi:DNA replication and repair protein RecF [Gimesia panareensis]|uniref:DNA replication and repair protein RecF n=1 Tax=Gimesia panareensis TaxID=2527978 RepID=A0A518FUW4_9PLAN|nr:ATP-binding protein [Gimesia panareensis]QDV20136.1 DNA replication and repair protein RecF [Gimesia panareensis]